MSVLPFLETIDNSVALPPPVLELARRTPSPSPEASSSRSPSAGAAVRISRLPPAPTVAGPSGQGRYLFVAVRSGHQPGVYVHWHEAERQLLHHPDPVYKTFSTRLAAEAYVAGWDGAGRHSIPGSCPRPLREHLAMNFPSSVPLSQSTSKRPSYHTRLLTSSSIDASYPGWTRPEPDMDFAPARPAFRHSTSSYRNSTVRIGSPLRWQLDDEDTQQRVLRKTQSFVGVGGLLTPPHSPEKGKPPGSVMDRERPLKPRGPAEAAQWASTSHRDINLPNAMGIRLPTPPTSPMQSAADKRKSASAALASSPLWSSATANAAAGPSRSKPPTPSPLAVSPDQVVQPPFDKSAMADKSAPKFSRSGLKKSGVVMPVAAPKSALKPKSSRSSLITSPSTSSLSSLGSTLRPSPASSRQNSQDRLATLAETTKRELQLNEEGLLALDALSPPRPAFMRRTPSNSSLSSTTSMTSMTSASSVAVSSLESCSPILEEEVDVQISCTKSDGDADASSTKSGSQGSMMGVKDKKGKKGGLFKRFSKALKLEKKDIPGHEVGRRPSV